jgi:hypothetical protein
MNNIHNIRRTAIRILLLAAIGSALHAEAAQPPQPGSFAAIMSVKDPARYLPHLPAADRPDSGRQYPQPGSWQAIMSVKDPAHYLPHLPAADLPQEDQHYPSPGSWEAIMSSKDPSHYGPHGRRTSGN